MEWSRHLGQHSPQRDGSRRHLLHFVALFLHPFVILHFHASYNMAPNTVDLAEWVVVSQDDEKKRGEPKKIPMVMKPKITLKVAKAVDNESASFSEASLGRSDWEWKPEEDASSVESGSSADHDSSAYEQKKGQYNQQREQNQKWFPTKRNKMRVPHPNSRGHAKRRGL